MNIDKENVFSQISHAIAAYGNLEQMFQALTNILRSVIQFDDIFILLYDPSMEKTSCIAPEGTPFRQHGYGTTFPFRDGLSWEVWSTQKSCKFDTKFQHPIYPKLAEVKDIHVESWCIVPLTSAERRLGVMDLSSAFPGVYTDQDVRFIEMVTSLVAVSVDNVLSHQRLSQLEDKLASEKLYPEEEIRTDHRFREIVGERLH